MRRWVCPPDAPRHQELAIFPSLFAMHTHYWSDWHRESVLGPERADNISPTGWVRDLGMRFGTHHDAPVALTDSHQPRQMILSPAGCQARWMLEFSP